MNRNSIHLILEGYLHNLLVYEHMNYITSRGPMTVADES